MFFRSRRSKTADPERELELAEGRSTEELIEELESLTRENQERPDADTEVKLVALRHAVGIRRLDEAQKGAAYPEPAFDRLPDRNGDLAGIEPTQLSPEVLRAGILRDGCLLIRGAVDRDARPRSRRGDRPCLPSPREGPGELLAGTAWRSLGTPEKGGAHVLLRVHADSPISQGALSRLDSGRRRPLGRRLPAPPLRDVATPSSAPDWGPRYGGYLGEPPLISVQKCTLRKVDPDAGRGWHQDGAFMGDVRALNVWLSLSHCGDEAPGMDVVPRRLDGILTSGQEGADFNWSISEQVAEEAAGETGIVRPIFEPGDVLLFDDLFLHTTAAEPSMPKSRLAIESWFFGASASPEQYSPLAA